LPNKPKQHSVRKASKRSSQDFDPAATDVCAAGLLAALHALAATLFGARLANDLRRAKRRLEALNARDDTAR
jgi:hypothetical protein